MIAIISASMLIGCATKPQQATDLDHQKAGKLAATIRYCKETHEIDTATAGTLYNIAKTIHTRKVYDRDLVIEYADKTRYSGNDRDCPALYAMIEEYKQMQQQNAEAARMNQEAWNRAFQSNEVKLKANCTTIGNALMCY